MVVVVVGALSELLAAPRELLTLLLDGIDAHGLVRVEQRRRRQRHAIWCILVAGSRSILAAAAIGANSGRRGVLDTSCGSELTLQLEQLRLLLVQSCPLVCHHLPLSIARLGANATIMLVLPHRCTQPCQCSVRAGRLGRGKGAHALELVGVERHRRAQHPREASAGAACLAQRAERLLVKPLFDTLRVEHVAAARERRAGHRERFGADRAVRHVAATNPFGPRERDYPENCRRVCLDELHMLCNTCGLLPSGQTRGRTGSSTGKRFLFTSWLAAQWRSATTQPSARRLRATRLPPLRWLHRLRRCRRSTFHFNHACHRSGRRPLLLLNRDRRRQMCHGSARRSPTYSEMAAQVISICVACRARRSFGVSSAGRLPCRLP